MLKNYHIEGYPETRWYLSSRLEKVFRSQLPGFTTRGRLHTEGKSRHLGAKRARSELMAGKLTTVLTPRELVDQYNEFKEADRDDKIKMYTSIAIAVPSTILFILVSPIFLIPALLYGCKAVNAYHDAGGDFTDFTDYDDYPVISPIQDMPQLTEGLVGVGGGHD